MNKNQIMDDLNITQRNIDSYSGVLVEKLFCAVALKLPEEQRISILTDFINIRDVLYNGKYVPAPKSSEAAKREGVDGGRKPPTAAATPLPTLNTGSRAIALWKQAMESYSSNHLLSWVGTHLKDINEAIAQRQADARDVTRCPTCGSSKTDIVFVSMRQCDACKIYFEA